MHIHYFDEFLLNQKYGFALQTAIIGNQLAAFVRWNTASAPTTYAAPQLPHGLHKIKWFISDGCGNETVCEYTFLVKDCKAPTVVCKNGLIGMEHLPDHLKEEDERRVQKPSHENASSFKDVERSYIYETLNRNEWNRSATAAEMGIHPTTLWRKMRRLNIEFPK